MLNKHFNKLEFILENLYQSTHAVGLAIVDDVGNVAAECGNLDIDVMVGPAARIISNGASLLASFTGAKNDPFFVWLDGAKGHATLTPVGNNLFLVIFYPKDIDILNIKDNISNFVTDIRSVFVELEPYTKG